MKSHDGVPTGLSMRPSRNVSLRAIPMRPGVAGAASSSRPRDCSSAVGSTTSDVWAGVVPATPSSNTASSSCSSSRAQAWRSRRGARDALQVPMEVEVALGASGTAVIRGYRWSRLGLKLEVLRAPLRRCPNAPPPEGPLSPKLWLTLANAAEAPLAIVDFAEHCAFHLVPVEWAPTPTPAAERCLTARPGAADVITLTPGQAHAVELDLAEPRRHVLKDARAVEIGALPGPARFRIEYRAPAAGRCRQRLARAHGLAGVQRGGDHRLPSNATMAFALSSGQPAGIPACGPKPARRTRAPSGASTASRPCVRSGMRRA